MKNEPVSFDGYTWKEFREKIEYGCENVQRLPCDTKEWTDTTITLSKNLEYHFKSHPEHYRLKPYSECMMCDKLTTLESLPFKIIDDKFEVCQFCKGKLKEIINTMCSFSDKVKFTIKQKEYDNDI